MIILKVVFQATMSTGLPCWKGGLLKATLGAQMLEVLGSDAHKRWFQGLGQGPRDAQDVPQFALRCSDHRECLEVEDELSFILVLLHPEEIWVRLPELLTEVAKKLKYSSFRFESTEVWAPDGQRRPIILEEEKCKPLLWGPDEIKAEARRFSGDKLRIELASPLRIRPPSRSKSQVIARPTLGQLLETAKFRLRVLRLGGGEPVAWARRELGLLELAERLERRSVQSDFRDQAQYGWSN